MCDVFKFKVPKLLEPVRNFEREPSRILWATPPKLRFILEYPVDSQPLSDAFKWVTTDVVNWIERIGFPQYRNTFWVNLINGRTLLLLDASALCAMNVKSLSHSLQIAEEIRKLYRVEMILFHRSKSVPPRYPDTHYKLFKVCTGPRYERIKRNELWREMKIIPERHVELNHWEKLTEWLKHLPYQQATRMGYTKRRDLYFVALEPEPIVEVIEKTISNCLLPWEMTDCTDLLKESWRLACLVRREVVNDVSTMHISLEMDDENSNEADAESQF